MFNNEQEAYTCKREEEIMPKKILNFTECSITICYILRHLRIFLIWIVTKCLFNGTVGNTILYLYVHMHTFAKSLFE